MCFVKDFVNRSIKILNCTQKTFKILSFSCFFSKHCSIWDWLVSKYFGRSSLFQWNMSLFQVKPLVIFAMDYCWTLVNIWYHHSTLCKSNTVWPKNSLWLLTYYSLTDLTSKTKENQISSKPMTILWNWGLNHWLFISSSQIKILPTNWSSKISLLWRFSLLTSKLTLCSGITKLFAFCPLCVWDLDESLPGLRYPLSRSSSVCKKNSPFFKYYSLKFP